MNITIYRLNNEENKMNKLKKFVAIKTIQEIEIFTDIGFVPLKNIMKTIPYDVYEISFSDGKIISCADNHIFITHDKKEIFAIDLQYGDKIASDNDLGYSEVISVVKTKNKKHMYDLQMQYYHKFYSNGVLSHNTTVTTAYILHQTIFNAEYTTAVLANNGKLSKEILSKIKIMYEELPWFLQMGVTEWNKGSITLGNKSRVVSSAASTTAVRGFSINCVSVDTEITVKNKNTGKIEKITMSKLKEKMSN